MRSLITPTAPDDWHSVAVCAHGDYAIEKGLMCSFPICTTAPGKWEVVQGVPLNEFSRARINATVNELKEERSLVAELIPS